VTVEGREVTLVPMSKWKLTKMLKWTHVRQSVTEIGIEIGNECETVIGTEAETERGTGTRRRIGREGRRIDFEKGTGIETETETEIAIGIVCRGAMVAGQVPLEVRAVGGEHEDQVLLMLTTEIGRWPREWDCESLTSFSSFDHGHFFVFTVAKDYAISTYSVSGTKSCCCILIRIGIAS
jgi:hypothetical protein